MILKQWQGIKTKCFAFNTKIIQRKVFTLLLLETLQTGPILEFLFGIESGYLLLTSFNLKFTLLLFDMFSS